MRMRPIVLAVGCAAWTLGCSEPRDTGNGGTDEIVDNLIKAGFPGNDIQVIDGLVYVGNDAAVSLAASREMLQTSGSSEEQFRTTNLVAGPTPAVVCVNGAPFTNATLSTGLNLALQNYNEQLLRLQFVRVTGGPVAGCTFFINSIVQSGLVGGQSGFPSGGVPFGQMIIGDGIIQFGTDVAEHVITHELGHTIGLRHSDFFNRSISCGGAAVNEENPPSGLGAILIPGTPNGAVVGGSFMNSCFRTVETGELTASDVTAVRRLYGRASVAGSFADAATSAPVTQAVSVTIEGPDRSRVSNLDGVPTTSFTTTNGTLSFGLTAGAEPSVRAPIRITLVVRASGFVPNSLPLLLTSAQTSFALRLTNVASPPPGVAIARGLGQADGVGAVIAQFQLQAVETTSSVTATVTVPAGTIITDAAGAPLTGQLTMDGAYFSPSVGSSLAAFPGGFSVDTTNAAGATSPGEFVSAGLMSVDIADANGRRAKNFSGSGIQIAMEIPAQTVNPLTARPIVAGDVIPVFSNDTATGRWSDEATVTVGRNQAGRLVAVFNARHLSLWNLDFKQNRCASPEFKSRRISVLDLFGAPVCVGKMTQLRIALSLVGAPAPVGYLRVLTPFGADANFIEFRNAPQVNLSVVSVFRDTNNNGAPDGADSVFGNAVFTGAVTTESNLCPNVTNTATLVLSVPQSSLPGGC